MVVRSREAAHSVTGLRGHRVRNPEKRSARREEMLLALANVLAVKSFEEATLDDVASLMGCSKAVIYYQFRSKADLFVALVERVNRDAIARLQKIASSEAGPEVQLRAAVDDLIRFGWQPMDYAAIRIRRPTSIPQAARDYLREVDREYENLFIDIVKRGMDEGVVVRRDPRLVAYTLINAVLSVFRWARPDGAMPLEAIAREVSPMLLAGVFVASGDGVEARD